MTESAPSASAFADPAAVARVLSPSVAVALLGALGDVTLVLGPDGRIRDVAVADAELTERGFPAYRGRDWADVVTVESRPKVAEMIAEARRGGPGRWRQINHPTAAGDVPVRYLAAGGGGDGGIVAIGRDLRVEAAAQQRLLQTQQSLERDYLRLRQAEARYRLLFDLSREAVLIVDAATRRVREINPAARLLLNVDAAALLDRPFADIARADDRDALVAYLGAASARDDIAPIEVRLAHREDAACLSARAFRQGRAELLLIRVDGTAANTATPDAALATVLQRMPDAFVLADESLSILAANAAFVELVGAASASRVVGEPLGDWLGRPGIDLPLIAAQLREHGSVRGVATILRAAGGAAEEIEVSAVLAPGAEHGAADDRYGFTMRGVARRTHAPVPAERDLPRSVDQLTELVGRMPLREIVRESTDLIERLCIEAALTYTADNRASAAEILGLSRQSLYSKLHRHGLGNLVAESDGAA